MDEPPISEETGDLFGALLLVTAPAWGPVVGAIVAFWIFVAAATSSGALYGLGVVLGGQHLRGPWWLGRRARDYRMDPGRRELLATILACYVLGAGVLSCVAVRHLAFWAVAATVTVVGGWAITELVHGRPLARVARLVAPLCFSAMWLVTIASPWFVSLLSYGPVVIAIALLWSAGAWALMAELVRLATPTTVRA